MLIMKEDCLMDLWKAIIEHRLSNFEYARSRLIWANRKNEPILFTPKSKKEVYRFKK